MSRFALGLVVGKFAPLHLGHEHLISHAVRSCERVLVLSYSSPELPGCNVHRRRRWLSRRVPNAKHHVIDDAWLTDACARLRQPPRFLPENSASDQEQHEFLGWLLQDVLGERPNAMFASEAYVVPCAAWLSVAMGHEVVGIRVDLERRAVPASGTLIRADVHRHRHLMSSDVYADFVDRVVLLGGESSGKTSLAAALAARCATEWIAEYWREHWQQRGGQLGESDLLLIAREQKAREHAALRRAIRYLFCDTAALTTLGYGQWLLGRSIPALEAAAAERPALAVLCAPDFAFVQDGTRRDAHFRKTQHDWYVSEITRRGWPWLLAQGPVDSRVEQVMLHLNNVLR